jgi:hypothetical protein
MTYGFRIGGSRLTGEAHSSLQDGGGVVQAHFLPKSMVIAELLQNASLTCTTIDGDVDRRPWCYESSGKRALRKYLTGVDADL